MWGCTQDTAGVLIEDRAEQRDLSRWHVAVDPKRQDFVEREMAFQAEGRRALPLPRPWDVSEP